MIRHIVWWKLKDKAGGRDAAGNVWHIQQASAMLHGSPYVTTIEVCNKVEPSTTVAAQSVMTTTHKNIEDLEAFRSSPIYEQFMEMVKPLADSQEVIDFDVDLDPALAGMGKPVY